jgi:uncharacterized small protein (DUF1192 family)
VNEAFLRAALEDFHKNGPEAFARCAKELPASYLKIFALLVPRELKIERANPTDALSDEQLALMVAELEERISARLQGENAKLIEAQAEPSAEPRINGWIGPPSKGAPGARKLNPKSTARALQYAREYGRKRRKAAKAAKGQAQVPAISDCTENAPSLPSSGEEQLK